MKYWAITYACILGIVATIDRKTRLLKVFVEQVHIYKNAKKNKESIIDLICFIVVPIFVSWRISYYLSLDLITKNAGTIVTVFSLIATLPLSFLALLADKVLERDNEKEVAKEVFVSITVDIIYSLSVIALVIIAAFSDLSGLAGRIMVGIITFFVIKVVLNILMIIKRVFFIWE